MTKDLKKQYEKEYDLLIDDIKNIESNLDSVKDRVARLELLDNMIQEANK